MGQAIFQQQKNGLYAVNVTSPGGVFSLNQLTELFRVAQILGVESIKCGIRQTIIFLVTKDSLTSLVSAIEKAGLQISPFGSTVRSVKACAGGEGLCVRMMGDALKLGAEIEKKYLGEPCPKDFKISTAGCLRGCTEPYCADFGVVATGKNAFTIVIGGKGASKKPIHGKVIAEKVAYDDVFGILDLVLTKYRELAEPSERLCDTISRVGLEPFKPEEVKEVEQTDTDFLSFLNEE